MIDINSFIKNIDKLQKQGCKVLSKEILDLFEPIVFQYVLSTRPDTGRARKEIGQAFARYVGSQRIIDATEYDVEIPHAMYNQWNSQSRADDFSSDNCAVLIQNGLLKVVIISDDTGLIDQEEGAIPSPNHTRPQNDEQRLPPKHLTKISNAVDDSVLLEQLSNPYIRDYIVKDVKERVDKLINKIEAVLFNG